MRKPKEQFVPQMLVMGELPLKGGMPNLYREQHTSHDIGTECPTLIV